MLVSIFEYCLQCPPAQAFRASRSNAPQKGAHNNAVCPKWPIRTKSFGIQPKIMLPQIGGRLGGGEAAALKTQQQTEGQRLKNRSFLCFTMMFVFDECLEVFWLNNGLLGLPQFL